MIIRIPLRFQGSKGEKYIYALFDSGATYSCITEEIAGAITSPEQLFTPMRLMTAKDDVHIDIKATARLDFYHDDIRLSDEFLIVPGLSEDVIIGAHTMQKWHLKLDFENNGVIVDPGVAKLILINLMHTT